MLIVAGTAKVDPSHISSMRSAVATMMETTRGEAGCHAYNLLEDPTRPGTIVIFELWESEAHLHAHFATPHMAAFNAALGGASPQLDVKIYDVSGTRPLGL